MNSKVKYIYQKLEEEKLDALLVFSPANISYLVGFHAQDARLLISAKENIYFTDSRYLDSAGKKLNLPRLKSRDSSRAEKARCHSSRGLKPGDFCEGLKGCGLKEVNTDAYGLIVDTCVKLGLKRVGFEKDYLAFAGYQKLIGIELIPVSGIVEELRQVKDKEELGKIRIAADIALKALRYIKDIIVPGKREIEVVGELEKYLRYEGASKASFDIIVASGPNSSFPHHISGKRKIQDNEPVLVDVGADYLGYKSDLTRVFFSGKINSLYRKIQAIVLKARELAILEIKPGKQAKDIDGAARSYIAKKGYGRYFIHSLGHGIGLEVHEGPRLAQKSMNVLKAGMVLTVEPAIYIPDKFGSRVEDMVIVTNKGCEVL